MGDVPVVIPKHSMINRGRSRRRYSCKVAEPFDVFGVPQQHPQIIERSVSVVLSTVERFVLPADYRIQHIFDRV